ncbi:hypothetical protein [Streptomyces roseolus]|uniref:hypothetical protein n=1 Tax=Streptomyces roseolus TaxID=67358 RepID=UPI00167335D7|nr:hypothetical protein [Streptomyces roseolus]GGR51576.1 hypothetical protein GCM10010282_50620 [Streptomyces roseolus]
MLEVIIAAVAVVVGASLGSWATLRAARTAQRTALETARTAERSALGTARIAREIKEADVEIVDVFLATREDLDELNEEQRASLGLIGDWSARSIFDVKLRNRGGETAYVYEVLIYAWGIRTVSEPRLPGKYQPSTQQQQGAHQAPPDSFYRNWGRDSEDGGHIYRISQVMGPGEADRFLLSAMVPAGFFRADVKVLFNGGRTVEAKDVKCFNPPPWVDAATMLGRLRDRLDECGSMATWNSVIMYAARAGTLCLDEYDENLAAHAALYELAGRTSDAEYLTIHESRSQVPQIRAELGLD